MNVYLIAGLGNPGIFYKSTRHNYGFMVVELLAKKHGLKFIKDSSFKAKVARGKIGDKDVLLVLPQTYMNESGVAVKKVLDFFKVELEKVLIVADDADIAFGEFKIKTNSSAGSHNGLASIEKHLNSRNYARLRLGIGRVDSELKSYVLSSFSKEEKKLLPSLKEKAADFIELWMNSGLDMAANQINVKEKKVKSNKEEKNEK